MYLIFILAIGKKKKKRERKGKKEKGRADLLNERDRDKKRVFKRRRIKRHESAEHYKKKKNGAGSIKVASKRSKEDVPYPPMRLATEL